MYASKTTLAQKMMTENESEIIECKTFVISATRKSSFKIFDVPSHQNVDSEGIKGDQNNKSRKGWL